MKNQKLKMMLAGIAGVKDSQLENISKELANKLIGGGSSTDGA